MTAALGLGTYRVRNVEQAARTALAAGAPWVDTAPNYANGQAHHDLAPVFRDHPGVRLATKTGFHAADQGRAAISAGVLDAAQPHAGHSLAPTFVRWQTENTLAELGYADIVFVHNPERSGQHRPQLHAALRNAVAVLEELAHAGRIGGYGVATWSGLESGAFTVPDLVRLAREAAGSGEHHLVGLQLPVSLVMADPITQALDGRTGPLGQAGDAGITTFGSAPLHGGELPHLMTPELIDLIRPGLTAAAAALLPVASCPGLDVTLLSASSAAHWDDALAAIATPLDTDHLRSVIRAVAPR
ncbi:aldo/keto reductase [Kitasatospora sp. NPDC059811]|uniref:aldo/keto reductase n=1 Tax=Streptomycetaceae TaxID=2062 RepID=UPI0007AF66C1|nr:aldo/keto reductase [Streptomyces sp. MJM8645]